MKLVSIILNLIIISGCHDGNESRINNPPFTDTTIITRPSDNNLNYDSLLLKYSNTFKATEIGLDKCLSEEMSSFILNNDTSFLERRKECKNFITIILAKLYYHHLQCCNQGYDLLSMKND